MKQRGAALLVALLTVALVATLASAAVWQQWRSTEVEQAERDRQQAGWVLTGALDWARLILREDARTNQNTGAGDHLAEPWAVGLEEARLSSFLAADKTGDPPPALDAFLSGAITDQQGLLNVANLDKQGAVSKDDVQAFERLFEQLGLPPEQVLPAAQAWLRSSTVVTAANASTADAAPADAERMLRPQRVSQLVWLGWSPATVRRLAPYVTVLPERTPVNLNTAPAVVLRAAVAGLDRAQAARLVSQRALQPFKTLTDATALVGGLPLNGDAHSTQSRYFTVLGKLRLGERVVAERSLVVRNGLEVQTLWRERVPPPPEDRPARPSPAS
jgi:general secretion pathway protein K